MHRRVRIAKYALFEPVCGLVSFIFSQDDCRTSGDVELQPTLPVTLKYGVVVREMSDGVVIEALAAESLGIGVEHHAVCSLLHHETIIYIRCGRREVEDEKQISALVRQNLVAIVVPNLDYRQFLELFLAFEHSEHGFVEVAEQMVAEFFVIYEVPLPTRVLMTPPIPLLSGNRSTPDVQTRCPMKLR